MRDLLVILTTFFFGACGSPSSATLIVQQDVVVAKTYASELKVPANNIFGRSLPTDHYTFFVDPSGSRKALRIGFGKGVLTDFATDAVKSHHRMVIDVVNLTATNGIDALNRFVLPGCPSLPEGLHPRKSEIRQEIEAYDQRVIELAAFLHRHVHEAKLLTDKTSLGYLTKVALAVHQPYAATSTRSHLIFCTDLVDDPTGNRPTTYDPADLLRFVTADPDRRELLIYTETKVAEYDLLQPLEDYLIYHETDLNQH